MKKPTKKSRRSWKLQDWAAMVLATWFGAGYFPIASGTLATALALPLVYASSLLTIPGLPFNPLPLLAAIVLFMPGVWAASIAERLTHERDSHKIVVDEVVGTFLTFSLLPWGAFQSWKVYLAGFFLFRLLDVWKPWWIRKSQILPRGWGVMVDDVLAGMVGAMILRIALKYIGQF
jgi:phosphatidylglycerophosphatase A